MTLLRCFALTQAENMEAYVEGDKQRKECFVLFV